MTHFNESLTNLLNIFASPIEAFRNLKLRPNAWLPLLVLIISWTGFWNYYYSNVDFPYLKDQLIEQNTYNQTAEQKAETVKSISKLKPGALIIISSVSVLFILLALIVVTSFYLSIMSAIFDDPYRFKHWFAFAAWTSMPSLCVILSMLINFLLADNQQIGPEQLNPLSLNNLIFNVGIENRFRSLLNTLDLTIIWSWVLMIIGYRTWTQKSLLISSLVILFPSILIYGIWFTIAFI